MTQKRLSLGRKGERLAGEYLRRQGYRIIAENFRTRLGEIDLIAKDRDTLAFVEVKTRSDKTHGSPLEAVTTNKQRQISKVALQYLCQEKLSDSPARFDVVSISFATKGPPQIELVKDAFELIIG